MPMFSPEELRAAVMRKLTEEPAAETAEAPRRPQGIGMGPYAALAGGSLADGISTVAALKRPGTVEANPLLKGGTAEMAAVKGGSTAALLWAMRELVKNGHPKVAKAIGYGGGAVLGGLAAHNMTQGK
jgi:hypothetical protein